jgi:voltage-gated potassium channel
LTLQRKRKRTRPASIEPLRRELRLFARRMLPLALAIVLLLAAGTAGFALSEGESVWFSFRWALDTVSTIGALRAPDNLPAQIISVLLIIFGVGTLFYALAAVTEFLVAGSLGELLAARRAQSMIDSLTDHHIVCGFGRVGRQVARDLRAAQADCVVIDADADHRERAQALGVLFLEGDAADDELLRNAGIERARSLIACADSDAVNIFITLSARELRDDIAIVARASVEDSEKKLLRAGADRVISPYKSSGGEMARLALHPHVTGVVDVDAEYRVEEIVVAEGAPAAHRPLGDVRGDLVIIGLRRDGAFQAQPTPDAVLLPGDVLIALGAPHSLDRLESSLEPAR